MSLAPIIHGWGFGDEWRRSYSRPDQAVQLSASAVPVRCGGFTCRVNGSVSPDTPVGLALCASVCWKPEQSGLVVVGDGSSADGFCDGGAVGL